MEHPIKAIKCGKILTPLRVIDKGVLLTEGRRIKLIGEEESFMIPPGAEVVDARELTLLPGFIDLHIHGWGGDDFRCLSPEALGAVSSSLPSSGITTYLLTVSDLSKKAVTENLERAAHIIPAQSGGARAAGVHLEGPFLNPSRRGAMRREALLEPDRALIDDLLHRGRGRLKMMTLSPELDGAMDAISHLRASGVVPCLGHSEADYGLAREAIERGARYATHTFNAMGPFHHRAPGLVGAVLTDDAVIAEVIPDGVHTHPATVKLLSRAKGGEGLVAVTDAHHLAGTKPGGNKDGAGREVIVAEDAVRFRDGNLAGGSTPMNLLVKNLAEFAGLPLQSAVASTTVNPARVIGIDKETGSLEEGKDADITAMDEDFNILFTMVKGEIVFRA
jgi:N-acetylglucosamine-6-phosphate deacetylase